MGFHNRRTDAPGRGGHLEGTGLARAGAHSHLRRGVMALGCAGAALVAAGCGLTASKTKTVTATHTVTVTHNVTTTVASSAANACAASDLAATFEALQGSAGAGNIVYTLKVVNASQAACTVSGVPTIDFLD